MTRTLSTAELREPRMGQFSENEMVTLMIGIGGLVFILLYRARLTASLPFPALFLAAFLFQLAGWFFTVVETVIWPDPLNILEHTSRFVSLLLLLRWLVLASRSGSEAT